IKMSMIDTHSPMSSSMSCSTLVSQSIYTLDDIFGSDFSVDDNPVVQDPVVQGPDVQGPVNPVPLSDPVPIHIPGFDNPMHDGSVSVQYQEWLRRVVEMEGAQVINANAQTALEPGESPFSSVGSFKIEPLYDERDDHGHEVEQGVATSNQVSTYQFQQGQDNDLDMPDLANSNSVDSLDKAGAHGRVSLDQDLLPVGVQVHNGKIYVEDDLHEGHIMILPGLPLHRLMESRGVHGRNILKKWLHWNLCRNGLHRWFKVIDRID
ncbi:hypothetical protein BCR33DRAFT_722757, partial [Rhizoclosmatium globosum]